MSNTTIKIQLPNNFTERYQRYRTTLLSILKEKEMEAKLLGLKIFDAMSPNSEAINKVIQSKAISKPAEITLKLRYENGILYFKGKEFDFNRKENQKELLNTLFKDPKKYWFYDEIQEDWDSSWDGVKKNNPTSQKYWEKFYTAGDKINTAIAIETGVKDFIIKNTGTKGKIKINPEYL